MSLTHREEVNLYEAIQKSFPQILIKDLTEHERICPACNGLGMRIENNIYGIKGDDSEAGRREYFPYKHQALSFCRSCFNGVQRLCPYCGQPYKNQGYMHCDCEGQQEVDKKKKQEEYENKIAKAIAVNPKDVSTMLYCEEFDRYYNDVEDFFEDYATDPENKDDIRPKVLWVTVEAGISVDAGSVIEDACYDLHEDASEMCDGESLQKLLDDWCKKQTGATTYYPCFKQYVEIDWSKYSE